MTNQIELINLSAQYLSIKEEIDEAIESVIVSSAFVRGPDVDAFEVAFAKLIGAKHCVSCANGTDSLYIALKALGVKEGDEVIVPAHTWISSSETVTQAGGRVVFCDTNDLNYTIDVDAIESKITSKTVGIIPVHLFGHPADMDPIMLLAKKYGLWVIEDCAQAHLAKYKNKYVGSFGDVASYSFYPGKNLGAMGDAGALTTNNEQLAQVMAMFARHGGLEKGSHLIEGINSRMDSIQAAILNVKLKYLEEWTAKRKSIASIYLNELKDLSEIALPHVNSTSEHVWHLFVIKHEQRNELKTFLSENHVSTAINYPIALPFLPAYKYKNHQPVDFPNAFGNQSRILSIPLCPELREDEQAIVIELLKQFISPKT